MTLVCFASVKGAPGTTLTALMTAASWPSVDGRRKLLLEADPDGGVLAVRYQMGLKPGLISMSAATRSGMPREELWSHAQALPGGLPVMFAPDNPEVCSGILRGCAPELGSWLSSLDDVDVIADVGRLHAGSVAMPLVAAADALLIVSRPVAADLQVAAHRTAVLRRSCANVGWVLVGEKPYTADDVRRAYQVPVLATLPDDRRAAALIEAGSGSMRVRRSPVVRSATVLASTLVDWLHPDRHVSNGDESSDDEAGSVMRPGDIFDDRRSSLVTDSAPTPLGTPAAGRPSSLTHEADADEQLDTDETGSGETGSGESEDAAGVDLADGDAESHDLPGIEPDTDPSEDLVGDVDGDRLEVEATQDGARDDVDRPSAVGGGDGDSPGEDVGDAAGRPLVGRGQSR